MRKVLIVAGIFGVVLFAFGQTTTPSWSGTETQQVLANCVLHNADSVVCVATDGIAFSYQGAPFVKVASVGATGPAGPAGPQGPQGPAGPPGPVQSFGTATCPAFSVSGKGTNASIVIGPGCTETTP